MSMMTFNRTHSEPKIQPYVKKASTTMNIGDPVFIDSSGFIEPAGASTVPNTIVGVVQETIASTDLDFATARDIMVDVADKGDNGDWFIAQVGTGTASQANVGLVYDLTSAGLVNLNATSVKAVKVQRFINASTVIVSFTGAPDTAVA